MKKKLAKSFLIFIVVFFSLKIIVDDFKYKQLSCIEEKTVSKILEVKRNEILVEFTDQTTFTTDELILKVGDSLCIRKKQIK